MKKLPFLIFFALVIISTSVCIIVDYQKIIMIASIIGFSCSVVSAVAIVESTADPIQINISEIIGAAGVGIGVILMLLVGFILASGMGFLFLFLGSILGSIVGCMYKVN